MACTVIVHILSVCQSHRVITDVSLMGHRHTGVTWIVTVKVMTLDIQGTQIV